MVGGVARVSRKDGDGEEEKGEKLEERGDVKGGRREENVAYLSLGG
jgi:hypothetical protein